MRRPHAIAGLVAASVALCVFSCGAVTPSDQAALTTTAGQIASCQAIEAACLADAGAGARCYSMYDACMRDAGLR